MMKFNFYTRYYLFSVFTSTDFIRGLHIVYLLELGYSNFFTGLCQTLLFVSILVFDIPSGFLADKYGNKCVLLFGAISFFASGLIYLSSTDMFLISLLYMLQGIGFAMYSGSSVSILYNNVQYNEGGDKNFHKYLSRSRQLSNFTLFIAISVGSLLYSYSWQVLFLVYVIFQIGTVFSASTLVDSESNYRRRIEKTEDRITTIESIRYIFSHKKLLAFIVCIAFLEAAHTPFFVFYQNLLESKGVEGEYISITIALALLASSFANLYAPLFKGIALYNLTRITLIVCLTICLIHFFDAPSWFLIPLFICFNAIPHILFIFTDEFINQHFENSNRATSLSIVSFINSVFISFTYLILGIVADNFNASLALIIPAGFLVLSLFIATKNKEIFQ